MLGLVGLVQLGCWEEVQEHVRLISEATGDERLSHIKAAIEKYPEWSLQCRETALPSKLHPIVLGAMQDHLESLKVPGDDGNTFSFSVTDLDTMGFLKVVRSLKALG